MKRTVWVTIAMACMVASIPALSQKTVHSAPQALRGLSRVGLVIDYEGPADSSDGLTQEQLRSEVMLRLKISGLRVVNGARPSTAEKSGELVLHVRALPVTERSGRADSFCYTLGLDLFQDVTMASEPRVQTEACTWSEGSAIVAPRDQLRSVTEMAGDLAFDFTGAIAKANQIQEPEVEAVP